MHRTLAALLLALTACSDREPVYIDPPDEAPDLAYELEDLPPALPSVSVAAGLSHTCALKSGALYCWGMGAHPASAAPALVPGMGSGVTAVVAGDRHTCALKGRSLYCWGANDKGQLGLGTDAPVISEPTPVQRMESVASISAGAEHTCALQLGKLYCWGDNTSGQLGDPALVEPSSSLPRQVPSIYNPSQVSAGGQHTCARSASQERCWGDNSQGQVGAPDLSAPIREPHLIAGREITARITAGRAHSCSILRQRVSCWGDNARGQLGDGSLIDSVAPVEIPAELAGGALQILAGHSHTCALLLRDQPTSAVSCWGANDKRQLGSDSDDRPSPAPVAGLTDSITDLAVGANHACAVRAGDVWCWGDNAAGQLGDATAAPTALPVRVNLP